MRARKRLRKASDDVVTHCNDTSTHGEPPQRDHEFRRGSSSSELEKDGYVQVELAEIREKVQCLICQGVIRNTRAVKECLHRFCQKCIDEYLLLRGNACPACHAHCESKSLRADPRYDALIEAFYPAVDKSKELAIHEETCKKQPETKAKASAAMFLRRSRVANQDPVKMASTKSVPAEEPVRTFAAPYSIPATLSEAAVIRPLIQTSPQMLSPTVRGSTMKANVGSISLPGSTELNNIKELLHTNVPKPILTPLSEITTEITVEAVKTRWKEFLELTREGYFSILLTPALETRAKELLAEICDGNPAYTETTQLKIQCEEFLAKFSVGIKTLKRNYDQMRHRAFTERGAIALSDKVERKRQRTYKFYDTYQALSENNARLLEEVDTLKAQLAEAECRVAANRLHMTQVWQALGVQTNELNRTLKESRDYNSGLDRQYSIKAQNLFEYIALDKDLMAFRDSVEKFLDAL